MYLSVIRTIARQSQPQLRTSANATGRPSVLYVASNGHVNPVIRNTAARQMCSASPHAITITKSYQIGRAHFANVAAASGMKDSLSAIFTDAEASFPSRFREHGWYLTVIAALIGSQQQRYAGQLYAHLVAQTHYQTSTARQALIRRLREAMVKCIIINGIPAVIEAVTAISELERPEDQDFSCTRETWNIGPETSDRAAKVLKVLYKSEKGGVVKNFTGHRDIPWISVNVSYGLFLSDHSILSMQETELVVLPAIMCQNLKGPSYWHLRACLRVGMKAEEVEAIHKVIERVAAFGGKTLDVQRVADVTDA